MARFITLFLTLSMGLTAFSYGQDRFAGVEIKAHPVGNGIYMLEGAGGNIGISVGDDGVFMIDDQYRLLTPKIMAAIGELTDKPVKFLINTHWHGDHTEGNENLSKMGAVIVAHDNVYQRMSSDQFMAGFNRNVPASPKAALPVITFNDEVTLHFNDLDIKARHFANGHTDGDSIIIFKDINIVHAGDLLFNSLYPYIDTEAGGSIYGMIDASAWVLDQVDDQTKIIPGHGPLATKQDLQDFHDMLVGAMEALTPLAKQGLSLEDANKTDPLKEFNGEWADGFLTPDKFVALIYQTIVDHN